MTNAEAASDHEDHVVGMNGANFDINDRIIVLSCHNQCFQSTISTSSITEGSEFSLVRSDTSDYAAVDSTEDDMDAQGFVDNQNVYLRLRC
jgi:hypothetical protein